MTTAPPSRPQGALRRVVRVVTAVELTIGAIALLAILVLVFFQAVQRYLPIDSVPGTGEIARFFEPGMMDAVSRAFQRIGFPKVSVDLKGYRTGSLNGPPADRPGSIPLPVISTPVFAHER